MKPKIVKADPWDFHWRLQAKGYHSGDKVIVSVPRRKGQRKLVKGVFRVHVYCECCGPEGYSIEDAEGNEKLSIGR